MCKKIKKAENLAILSSCCGVTGEAVLTDSAVILLFAASLGGKEYLGLLSMAVLPLLNGLLILPLAKLSNRFGNRKLITGANILALCGYFLAASAPWWGNTPGKMILLGGILFFSICQTGFLAGWFPFLESFLLPERRTLFLGRMRFYHQLAAVSFLGLTAFLIGREPAVNVLQRVLFLGGIIFAGRILFISLIAKFPEVDRKSLPWLSGIRSAVKNPALKYFSFYTLLLNLGLFSPAGVILQQCKSIYYIPENELILISGSVIAGPVAGYATAAFLEKIYGKWNLLTALHFLGLGAIFSLLFITPETLWGKFAATLLLMTISFVIAAGSVICGATVMAFAPPGNKTLAMAFWGCFYYGGGGFSRLFAAFTISCGKLPLYLSLFFVLTAFLPLLAGRTFIQQEQQCNNR